MAQVSQTHVKPKKEPRNFADSSDEEYDEETPGGETPTPKEDDIEALSKPARNG